MISNTTRETTLLEQPLNVDLLKFLSLNIQIEVIRLITLDAQQRIQEITESFETDDHCKWIMEW